MGGSGSKLNGVKTDNPIKDWQIQQDLGSGSYGKVHKVRNRVSGDEAAAKVAAIHSKEQLVDFQTEIDILTQCRHANITNFVDAYYHSNDLWIIIEVCDGGAISDHLDTLKAGFPEYVIAHITYQMLMGLRFLHANGIIHRDINNSNTLLTKDGSVKLADFGVSALNKSDGDRRSTFVGSPHWMAPEVVKCENTPSSSYDSLADVWSLGITLIEMAEYRPPYHDMHPMKVLFKIMNSPPPTLQEQSTWSPMFHAFLALALTKDASKRTTAARLLSHSFCADKSDPRPVADLASGRLVNQGVARVCCTHAQTSIMHAQMCQYSCNIFGHMYVCALAHQHGW
eukprot:m.168871 g.168871  ORF g.168871 m.168871 type:complete len:340 (-) comp14488_c1_seq3:667-1686(-)